MVDTIVLQVAKSAILSKFDNNYNINKEIIFQKYPFLKKDGAAFVTLHYNNNLRGCIGSIIAHQTLLNDLIQNAKSAAFNDPRFNALSEDEFSNLTLEISILSEPKILEYDDYDDLLKKVQPNIDGLILKHGNYQGTFLPQVWEQLQTPKLFLEHLSMKAGATKEIYSKHPTIYRYGVEHIKEKFDEVLPL